VLVNLKSGKPEITNGRSPWLATKQRRGGKEKIKGKNKKIK